MTIDARRELIEDARGKQAAALEAHRAGDVALRDAFLRQAADRYREVGLTGHAAWCLQFTTTGH